MSYPTLSYSSNDIRHTTLRSINKLSQPAGDLSKQPEGQLKDASRTLCKKICTNFNTARALIAHEQKVKVKATAEYTICFCVTCEKPFESDDALTWNVWKGTHSISIGFIGYNAAITKQFSTMGRLHEVSSQWMENTGIDGLSMKFKRVVLIELELLKRCEEEVGILKKEMSSYLLPFCCLKKLFTLRFQSRTTIFSILTFTTRLSYSYGD
ncbi:uncharacterized protein LOC130642380 [Hydractinia symbiolongicarpus]|uniref:uncharacterized protein LOC130642380 n=1 Tax=Hydractinia symbiolongicarpus TaxID=13093 RepID=UPI00254BF1B9|nr:uncharacterized protein LOC130642380 [Hydractinia symbiolongicarpus]